MIDYKELLQKYIEHVGDTEGVDYVPSVDSDYPTKFTKEEIIELNKLSRADS